MNRVTDLILVSRCLLFDDRKAFSLLVGRYQERVRRFFLNQTLGNRALSDDLAQETFIRVYYKLNSFRGLSGFSTWLLRIAYNVFYDFRRREQKYKTCGLEVAEEIQGISFAEEDKKMDIYHSLCILKEEERMATILFYMEDMNIDKISKMMNCPQGTVKSHLSRARVKLKDYLKNNGYGDNDR